MHATKLSLKTTLITAVTMAASAAAALGAASPASASPVRMIPGGAYGPGVAAARPAVSGTERFQLMTTSASSRTYTMIATGAFTAGGTEEQTTNSTDTARFPGGTFLITHSRGHGTQSFNPRTCLLQVDQKGTYRLHGGTGAYAHIGGGGTYQLTILAVGAKSGGKCSQTLPPRSWEQVIVASGPVSRP